jgi:holo-ACP synthase / triphosphoribosyl-dephospho-CoA synthase
MEIIEKILKARESRSELRCRLTEGRTATLSLSLNIPGYPKSDQRLAVFFNVVLADLKRYLAAHRIELDKKNARRFCDEAGDFFIAPLVASEVQGEAPPGTPKSPISLRITTLETIKSLCESFEESHPVGRVIDIDIFCADQVPVSSGKAKKCFICENKPAVACMREETHSKEELRSYILPGIHRFLETHRRKDVCTRLASLATKAALHEVSLSPKPGTVDRFDSGSHDDMDFCTFMNSTSALSPYFYRLAEAGFNFDGPSESALPSIRAIGLEMEEAMFRETGGVNTQKGIIFLFGITLFVTAHVIRKNEFFERESFVQYIIQYIKLFCNKLTENELDSLIDTDSQRRLTHGEQCFRRYGKELGGGVRYEVEMGLPTVFNCGLPVLQESLKNPGDLYLEQHLQEPLTRTLLSIMSVNNDSNILFRKGKFQLESVKSLASEALRAETSSDREKHFTKLVEYCRKENLSPGGSTDLLAVTLLLFFICRVSQWLPADFNSCAMK